MEKLVLQKAKAGCYYEHSDKCPADEKGDFSVCTGEQEALIFVKEDTNEQ